MKPRACVIIFCIVGIALFATIIQSDSRARNNKAKIKFAKQEISSLKERLAQNENYTSQIKNDVLLPRKLPVLNSTRIDFLYKLHPKPQKECKKWCREKGK